MLAVVTLLKGKIWTGLFGVFAPPLFIVGAVRLARPGSPWARWRYRDRPGRLARARRREERLRLPVINAKIRVQDLLTGRHDQPPATPAERRPRAASGTAAGRAPGRTTRPMTCHDDEWSPVRDGDLSAIVPG